MDVISEREAYLLRERQRMLLDEDLLGMPKDTVIVAARRAWQEYQDLHAYICQPDRAFQPVRHLGFYADGRILLQIPRILERHHRVVLEADRYPGPLGVVVKALLARGRAGEEQQVFVLSAPTAPGTLTFPAPIPNDLRSSSGRPLAFTQTAATSVSRTWNLRYSRRR